MQLSRITKSISLTPAVILWGAFWGIFEATVGYLLHLLPFKLGAYIWFPAAYGFMAWAYRATGRKQAVLWVGLLSGGIKLFNLLTPIRADYVINPAVSIVLEAMAMGAVLWGTKAGVRPKAKVIPLMVLGVNTGWRLLYLLYLAVIAPAWMREVSVLQSAEQMLQFLLWDNGLSTLVATAIALLLNTFGSPRGSHLPILKKPAAQYTVAGCLLMASIGLQILL